MYSWVGGMINPPDLLCACGVTQMFWPAATSFEVETVKSAISQIDLIMSRHIC